MSDEDIPSWEETQKRTFTRWCNELLKERNIVIKDLATDLSDGLKLIALYEVLAQKQVKKYNKGPKKLAAKRDNIQIALDCFTKGENVTLVSIHSENIAKGNLTEILGLIWTLILKYQISSSQALLKWVKSKISEDIPMNNFTSDWSDGRAITALVHAIEPGLYPDVKPEDLDPKDAKNNVQKAISVAELHLGIPAVIEAADMCNPKGEGKMIMTYVSYFPKAKCKPQFPAWAKCSAEGPGLTPKGLVAKQPTHFTVITAGAGEGSLQVDVLGPEQSNIPCAVVENADKTFSCKYIPPDQGIYNVDIKWKGRHIPKSPFRVLVSSELKPSDGEDSVEETQEEKKQKLPLDLFMFDFGADSTTDVEPYLFYTLGGF